MLAERALNGVRFSGARFSGVYFARIIMHLLCMLCMRARLHRCRLQAGLRSRTPEFTMTRFTDGHPKL